MLDGTFPALEILYVNCTSLPFPALVSTDTNIVTPLDFVSDLTNNSLTAIPDSVFDMSSLQELYVECINKSANPDGD